MRTRWFSFSFGLLLIFSSSVYHIPYSVEAQGTPEYNDVSNGLPTQGLWVSKVRLHDIDEDGTDEAFFIGPRKGQGDRSLHVMQWDGNVWSNVSSTFGTEVINHHSYGGFDFGDIDDLCKGMLYFNKSLPPKLKQENVKRALDMFEFDVMWNNHLLLYKKALS